VVGWWNAVADADTLLLTYLLTYHTGTHTCRKATDTACTGDAKYEENQHANTY